MCSNVYDYAKDFEICWFIKTTKVLENNKTISSISSQNEK